MNERELLEFAAKAADMGCEWSDDGFMHWPGLQSMGTWNPLEDDGDALNLAVKLGISINFWDGFKQVICRRHEDQDNFEMHGVADYSGGC